MPSRHRLSATAHNVLHAMASGLAATPDGFLSQHLARAAATAHVPAIVLDLHAGAVAPAAAATPVLAEYATYWHALWPAIAVRLGADPATVRAFVVTAAFDLSQPASWDPSVPHIVSLIAEVTDDHGRVHRGAPPRRELYLGA